MIEGLAKTDTRVKPDTIRLDAAGHCDVRTFGQIIAHLIDHILILGLVLHGLGLALHVHQHHRHAQLGRCGNRSVRAQSGDIIPDISAGLHCRTGHIRLERIHRDACRCLFAQGLDHRDDAAQFLIRRHRFSARPGTFAAHINHVRAVGQHLQTAIHRTAQIHKGSAVGETVRRNVQNAHDEWKRGFAARLEAGHGNSYLAGARRYNRCTRRRKAKPPTPGQGFHSRMAGIRRPGAPDRSQDRPRPGHPSSGQRSRAAEREVLHRHHRGWAVCH